MTGPDPDFNPYDLTEPKKDAVEDTHSPDDSGVESCVDDTEEETA